MKNFRIKNSKNFGEKRRKSVGLLQMVLISLMLMPISLTHTVNVSAYNTSLFNPTTNVTYSIEMTFDLDHVSGSGDILLWDPSINNWTTTQDSQLITHTHNEMDINSVDPNDIYNNSFSYYQESLTDGDPKFYVSNKYETKVYGGHWKIPTDLTLDAYQTDFNLGTNYTCFVPGVEINDSDIIAAVDEVTSGMTNVKEIIEAIYNYVIDTITYVEQSGGAKGAAQVLDDGVGDCSEYSQLMIAMLRVKGIPARKVLGFILSPVSSGTLPFDMEEGDSWDFSISTLAGHAWIQYYVPGVGWISADPTWGYGLKDSNYDPSIYLTQMDYTRVITTVGDWYGEGIDPSLLYEDEETEGLQEIYSYLLHEISLDYDGEISYRIEVIEIEKGINPNLKILIYIGIGAAIVGLIGFMIKSISKKREKGTTRQRKYDKKRDYVEPSDDFFM